MAVRKQRNSKKKQPKAAIIAADSSGAVPADVAAVMQIDQQENELEEKVKRVQGMQVGKSGSLVFCAGEA